MGIPQHLCTFLTQGTPFDPSTAMAYTSVCGVWRPRSSRVFWVGMYRTAAPIQLQRERSGVYLSYFICARRHPRAVVHLRSAHVLVGGSAGVGTPAPLCRACVTRAQI